jgi:large subunit ribosomal protein L15
MKHHELEITANKPRKRAGRGIAAGQGKTAGRGTKGQNSRSGGKTRRGFEGGQIPLAQRIPKMKGFRPRPSGKLTVTTRDLSKVKGTTVDTKSLAEANVIDSEYRWVKLIVKGEVTKKFTVKLPAISEGAKTAIEKAGGSFVETERTKRPAKKSTEAKTKE